MKLTTKSAILTSQFLLALITFIICITLDFSIVYAQIPHKNQQNTSQNTDCIDAFFQKRYGVFFHYLNSLQNTAKTINSLGQETSWDDCVNEFDVERFADQVEQTGAGYVFFTMMQQTRFLAAPNETFDRLTGYRPGEACASRDLVMEIANALARRNIDLYLYWTGDGPSHDSQAFQRLHGAFPVTTEYMQNWSNVAAEYGTRYGEKVKGWWIDGAYAWIGHNSQTHGILAEGLRTGNPRRILAFNPGVDPVVQAYSDCDDFTAGEQNSFTSLPESGRFLRGAQWHILTFLGNEWGAAGTKLTKDELARYVWTANQLGGVVTIDLLLYRDGGLDRSQLETLKPLRKLLSERDSRQKARVATGNFAVDATAFLRSNDGTRTLVPSCGAIHEAQLGIDGDPNTSAVGGGDWAWSYIVYIPHPETAQRVTIQFGEGWPTDFELFIKLTNGEWKSIGRFDNPDGEKSYDVSFAPEEIEAVKVTSWKPDGEDQIGGQMSVAELGIFAKP